MNVTEGIICHQVNMQKAAGAGLALQIRKKWHGWYVDYQNTDGRLGMTTLWKVKDGLWVANLYSQNNVSWRHRMTDYDAFTICLRNLRAMCTRRQVFFPYGIGCGIARGDWDVVLPLIEEYIPDATIVKWVPSL